MKILLINPNTYKSPPVPPIGLEYLAASLEGKGHTTEILDLCFSDRLHEDIDRAVISFEPDIAGITLRNIDTVLYHTNEFFLNEIRDVVTHIKSRHGLRVIAGGTGVSANPRGILEYLNADCAIVGPAEDTIHEVLKDLQGLDNKQKVYYGKYTGNSCPRRPLKIDYKKYSDSGGLIGFETHKGCSSSCVYCLEANSRVSFKNISDVLGEIKSFADIGYDRFHLCDPEFNENLEYAADFCTTLKKTGPGIKWAVYMKPVNFNKNLFRLLKEAGVYLITLSMDSWKKCDLYWSDYAKFVFGAKAYGIKIAVDFLTGFPHEKDDSISEHLDLLRRPLPDTIGVNTYIRLYKSLAITNIIINDTTLRDNLLGNTDDRTFITPVFYNQIDADKLSRLIQGDQLFRVEGLEKGVNYTRL
jgi:anaerobic magnesium-protoporphyrin IX monomethyl ester cyclase